MDLSTKYLGLQLNNPFVLSSCPLSEDIDALKAAQDAGMGAVVMFSLFEEQIRAEDNAMVHYMEFGNEFYAESQTFFPEPVDYKAGPTDYLEKISAAKKALDVPVIGSLNGVTNEGWIDYARRIQEAGADALELNVYYLPTGKGTDARDVEQRYINVLKAVKQQVSIPVAMKLSPYFSATGQMCRQLVENGADGLVLFNRFYQPDIDVEELELERKLKLSSSDELNVRLRWLAILHGRVQTDLAVTGGIHTAVDALKAVMCGASACQMVSALLMHGPAHLAAVRESLSRWLVEHEYESLAQARGSMSLQRSPDPHIYERANYLHILRSWEDSRPVRKA